MGSSSDRARDELEEAGRSSSRRADRVLDGQADYDDLDDPREQAAVRATWRERTAERLAGLDFAAEFSAADESYAELDENEHATLRRPVPEG
jgi:hypothetical protein